MIYIDPKTIEIENPFDGTFKQYIVSKVPARKARKIFTQYLPSAMPKIGDYETNERLMDELMTYVQVISSDGTPLPLSTPALIDNHVPNFEMLIKLEAAMVSYNCSFFQNGKISHLFDGIAEKFPQWITKTLKVCLAQSSQTATAPSEN